MTSYYYDKGTVKRYTKKIKNTSKNAKTKYRTVETVNIGLSKFTEFQDGDEVAILKLEDYKKLTEQEQENNNKQPIIIDDNKNQVIKLQEEINNLKDIINNRNELLLSASKNVNNLIDELLAETQQEYKNLVIANEKENKLRLKEFINSIIRLYENTVKTNQAVASEIQELEEKHNQELKEAGLFKLWRNRQDYKINIPTSKLKEPRHELEDLKLLDVDLATSKVLRQPEFNQVNINKSKFKEIDFQQLYIKTGKQDE